MKRIQLDLQDHALDRIDEQMLTIGCFQSRKDYFNTAITLLDWAINESLQGNEIGTFKVNGEQFTKIVVPGLSKLRQDSIGPPPDSQTFDRVVRGESFSVPPENDSLELNLQCPPPGVEDPASRSPRSIRANPTRDRPSGRSWSSERRPARLEMRRLQ